GALIGTLSLGVVAAPALPALGQFRQGPAALELKMPLGWRRAANSPISISYSNGLTGAFRSSATLIREGPCRGHLCTCERRERGADRADGGDGLLARKALAAAASVALAGRHHACYGRVTRWRASRRTSSNRSPPPTGETRFRPSCAKSPGCAGSAH